MLAQAEGQQPSFRYRRSVLLTAQGRLRAGLPQIRMRAWCPTSVVLGGVAASAVAEVSYQRIHKEA